MVLHRYPHQLHSITLRKIYTCYVYTLKVYNCHLSSYLSNLNGYIYVSPVTMYIYVSPVTMYYHLVDFSKR